MTITKYRTIRGKNTFILIFQVNREIVESIIHNQDTVTHSNTAAGDNCHAHRFLIPQQNIDIENMNLNHQDTVNWNGVENIMDDTSDMANKFDGTSISTDQDAVTLKLSNTATSQIETLDCLVGNIKHHQQDPVIQKLPETNTNDVEKITDDTMAPTASTSAAKKVGL